MRSFVLRLVDSALRDGRIAGQVEVVHSGQVVTVRSAEDLLACLFSEASPAPAPEERGTAPCDHDDHCGPGSSGFC